MQNTVFRNINTLRAFEGLLHDDFVNLLVSITHFAYFETMHILDSVVYRF